MSIQPRNLDRPIVVSARFYEPKKHTHFQLYRLNPDGSGRQKLTSGDAEDYTPRWAPDGNHILFVRSFEKLNPPRLELHQIRADGTGDRKLWETTSEYKPSFYKDQDDVILSLGRKRYVFQDSTQRLLPLEDRLEGMVAPGSRTRVVGRTILREEGSSVTLPPELDAMGWLSTKRLLCITKERPGDGRRQPPFIHVVTHDGKVERSFRVTYSPEAERLVQKEGRGQWRHVFPVPWSPDQVLLSHERGDSLAGIWQSSLLLDLNTRRAEVFGEHGRLALAPNGYEYVTTYHRRRLSYFGRQITLQNLVYGDRRQPNRQRILLSNVELNSCDWYGGKELRVD